MIPSTIRIRIKNDLVRPGGKILLRPELGVLKDGMHALLLSGKSSVGSCMRILYTTALLYPKTAPKAYDTACNTTARIVMPTQWNSNMSEHDR